MKASFLILLTMGVASFALAGVLGYSAYAGLFDKPFPSFIGVVGAIAAIVLVIVGRSIQPPK